MPDRLLGCPGQIPAFFVERYPRADASPGPLHPHHSAPHDHLERGMALRLVGVGDAESELQTIIDGEGLVCDQI